MTCRKWTEPRTGLWCTSFNVEHWSPGVFFENKRDAIAYGLGHGHRHVGQVVELTAADVAEAFLLNGEEADERLALLDEWAWSEDRLVREPSADARAEVFALVKAWVEKHDLFEPTWRVDNAQTLPAAVAECGSSPPVPDTSDPEPDEVCEGCQQALATCWSDDDVYLCAKCLEACDPVTDDGCPVDDPGCDGRDGDRHDTCERQAQAGAK